MGVFFSLTDISEYEFGGGFDKGFYFYSVESFLLNIQKDLVGFGLDLLQEIAYFITKTHSYTLYGVTEQGPTFKH